MKDFFVSVIVCLILTLGSNNSMAALTSCSVTPVSGPGVLAYEPGAVIDLSSTFNIQISCIALLSAGNYTIGVSFSPGLSGDSNQRQAAFGAQRLNYNLFLSGGAIASDTGTGLVSQILSLGLVSSTLYNLPITLVIPKGQFVPPGAYSDTVNVTVSFD